MKTAPSIKTITYLTALTVITSCGGGGGGGGAQTSAPTPDSSVTPSCSPLQASAFNQQFNTYLPINTEAEYQYSHVIADDVDSSFSYDSAESEDRGVPVYNNTYTSNGENIVGLLLTSAPSAITLHGLNGPITFEYNGGNVLVEELRFADSIPLYDGRGTITGDTTATSVVRYGGAVLPLPDFIIRYTIVSGDSNVLVNGNPLPSKDVNLNVNVTIPSTLFTPEINFDLDANLSLSPGVGIVANEILVSTSLDTIMQGVLTSTTNLPNTIWYEANSGNPILSTGSEATFSTSAGTMSMNNYAIANLDQLNALSWLQINSDEASCTYNVDVIANGLPTSLTSVEVIFEDQNGGYTSGNVTLKP